MLTAAEIKSLLAAEYEAVRDGKTPAARRDFLVPEANLPALKKKLDGYVRRAGKLGVEEISYTVGDYVDDVECKLVRDDSFDASFDVEDSLGNVSYSQRPEARYVDVVVRKYAVHVEGPAPKLSGWVFGGTLQHLRDDQGKVVNVVRSILEGVQPPVALRTAEPRCAHCNTVRRRIDTFLVYSPETQEWKQIGRNCICDFLGRPEGDAYARRAESLADILGDCREGEEGEGFGGGRGEDRWPILAILAQTAVCIANFGWQPRSKCPEGGTPTAAIVGINFASRVSREDRVYLCTPEAEHVARAEAALAWVKALTEADGEKSDYLANINAIARVGTVTPRLLGYACSIVSSHKRHLDGEKARIERAAAKAGKKPSEWVGEVGERIVLKGVTVKKIIQLSYEGYGAPSVTNLHIMETADGNTVKWFASNGGGFGEGDVLDLKGTVKKHDFSKKDATAKETLLSRCDEYFEPIKKNKVSKAVADGIGQWLSAWGNALHAGAEACREPFQGGHGYCTPVVKYGDNVSVDGKPGTVVLSSDGEPVARFEDGSESANLRVSYNWKLEVL